MENLKEPVAVVRAQIGRDHYRTLIKTNNHSCPARKRCQGVVYKTTTFDLLETGSPGILLAKSNPEVSSNVPVSSCESVAEARG